LIRLTRLKAVRQRKLLTQQDLAKKAGVSRPTVVRIEGGLEDPFPSTIKKLAAALGVDPEALMEPEDP
jgi:transcriptional regulator with XRE-family HTH domain